MEPQPDAKSVLHLLADLLPLIHRHGEQTFYRVVSMSAEEMEQLVRENETLIKKLALERLVREISAGSKQ